MEVLMNDRIIVGSDGFYQLWDDLLPIGKEVRSLAGAYLQITTPGSLRLRWRSLPWKLGNGATFGPVLGFYSSTVTTMQRLITSLGWALSLEYREAAQLEKSGAMADTRQARTETAPDFVAME